MSKKTAMHIYAILATSFWALGYVMTRIAVLYFTADAMAFLRYLIAAISLLSYAAIKKMHPPKLKDVPMFFAGGAIGFAVYVYAINVRSRTLTASVVSFIVSASPIVTALLARVFLKERIGLIGWASVAFAFAGVGLITWFSGGFTLNAGAAWICLAMLLISLYNIYQRKLLTRYSPLEITTYCIVAGAILLSVFAPHAFPQLIIAPMPGVIAIVILGVFSAGIAYLCWASALGNADKTSEVTNYMFVTPILTTLLGFILIGETPNAHVYIGGAMVLAGIILVNSRGIKKKTKPYTTC